MRKRNYLISLSFVTAVLLLLGVPVVKNKFWPHPFFVIDVRLTMCLEFASTQNTFWTGQRDGIVKEWDAHSGKLLRSIKCSSVVWCLYLSDDGKLLFIGCDDGTVTCYNLQSNKRLSIWNCGQKPLQIACTDDGAVVAIAGFRFTPDGSTAGTDTLTLWNSKTGSELNFRSVARQFKRVTAMKFYSEDKLIVGDARGITAITNWKKNLLLKRYILQGAAKVISLRGDGGIVVANHGVTKIPPDYKQESYVPTNVEATVGGKLQEADLCLPKNLLIGFASDSVLHIWDLSSGTELKSLKRPEGTEKAAKFSPDGKLIVCAYYDRVELWKTDDLIN